MRVHLITNFPIEERLGAGCYAILFEMNQDASIETGRLGVIEFRKGFYAYVGSARLGISGRLGHHLKALHPKPRWHLDYLLPEET